ncbi:unnamed protein product [Brassicogethes aeneus]|uniref:Cilia- and flagella-associated protein 263 n=1 Tax=Brassicogethes aeneus TaxID=1431903 RepID=A0A9P0AX06_BRAAE|nr:unnamed protein product [Brassicogethes aeneus]
MAELSKFNQSIIQKLILYTNYEKLTLKKLTLLFAQREQLAENVQAVDFEQLVIENKNLNQKFQAHIKNVKILKTLNGWANLVRSTYKHYLKDQAREIVHFKEVMQEQKLRNQNLLKEISRVRRELEEAESDYNTVKTLKETYRVPSTMKYIELKDELYNKNSRITIIQRRKKILDIAILACSAQMKHLVGTKKVNPKWFKDIKKKDSYSLINSTT